MVKQIFRTNVTVINKSQSNLQTCFRTLFTAITLSFNPFCALHINDEIKTSFTLLSLHCRPIFTIHSAISCSVSCLLPISLQPMYNIKTSGVSWFKIGFTYVGFHLFQSGAYKRSKSVSAFLSFEFL